MEGIEPNPVTWAYCKRGVEREQGFWCYSPHFAHNNGKLCTLSKTVYTF